MRNNYSNSKSYIEEFSQIINFNFTSDTSLKTSALLDIAASNLSGSSRIRSRRVSSFNSTALLMKSFEFTGMNSSVLRSRGSSSSPAFNDSEITFYVENKLVSRSLTCLQSRIVVVKGFLTASPRSVKTRAGL